MKDKEEKKDKKDKKKKKKSKAGKVILFLFCLQFCISVTASDLESAAEQEIQQVIRYRLWLPFPKKRAIQLSLRRQAALL